MIEHLGYDSDYIRDYGRTQRLALSGFVVMAGDLAERLPDITFVLRPHPFEDLEYYVGSLRELPNLHLSKEGTVDGWILRAVSVGGAVIRYLLFGYLKIKLWFGRCL